MKQDKTLLMLGLAQRAGKVASGEFSTEKAVKSKKAFLVVVASDASDNTKKMFSDMCTFYKVPIAFYSDKVSLGHAIGKEFRASLAVLDEGFGKQIQNTWKLVWNNADVKLRTLCYSEKRLNG